MIFNDLLDTTLEKYKEPLTFFAVRLVMKHVLNGTGHLKMTFDTLDDILSGEMDELDDAYGERLSKVIEEATDVMISAMLIVHKALVEAGITIDGPTGDK